MATAPSESTTIRQFLELLQAADLLSAKDWAALEQWPEAGRAPDAGELARSLVQQGKLTKHQAAALYQRRPKGLGVGRYVFLDRLGTGGSGSVYKSRHRQTGAIVAVKVLNLSGSRSADALKRFQREAETAARLNHPNIVRAMETGEAGGQYFTAMEFVEGTDLSTYVKKQGPLPFEQAAQCIIDAARALAYAHEQGIVHRDIKPANLMLCTDGKIKVLDMGLARLQDPAADGNDQAAEGLTQTGQVMGTVDYMAPEQALNTRMADARSDVYGLGCSFYRLVTGDIPFDGDSMVAKILAHREKPIPSICKRSPKAPKSIDVVLQRMLAKKPEDRYPSMGDVADDLLRSIQGYAVAPLKQPVIPAASMSGIDLAAAPSSASLSTISKGRTVGPTAERLQSAERLPAESTERTPAAPSVRRRRTPRWIYAAAGFVAAAILGGGALWLTRTGASPPTEDPPELVKALPVPTPPVATTSATATHSFSAVLQGAIPTATPSGTALTNSVAPPPATGTATASSGPATSTAAANDDRRLAEYLVNRGMQVLVWNLAANTPLTVSTLEALPAGDIYLIAVMNRPPETLRDDDVERLRTAVDLVSLAMVSANGLSDASLRSIAALPRLQTLILRQTPIGDASLPPLETMPNLVRLDLGKTQVTEAGLDAISRMSRLVHLSLAELPIGDAGLAKLTGLRNLRTLNLEKTRITDASIAMLSSLTGLQELTIRDSQITPEGRGPLVAALPQCVFDPPLRSQLTIIRPQIPRPANLIASATTDGSPVTPPPSTLGMAVATTTTGSPGALGTPNTTTTTTFAPPPAALVTAPPDPSATLPVPETKALDEALALIRGELFKDDYAAAKKPEERVALGRKLLAQAAELRDDPVGRYVLLREARDLGAEGGDVDLIVSAATVAETNYQIEAVVWLVEACEAAQKRTFARPANKAMAEALLTKVEDAVRTDQYELAERLLNVAMIAGRKTQDATLLKSLVERDKKFDLQKKRFDEVTKARATLADKPDDPAANLTVGKYVCFVERRWDEGLAFLAKGGDAGLKELAQKSIPAPTSADALVTLADLWWNKGEKAPRAVQSDYLLAALHWYESAAPQITGLVKSKVDKRIADARTTLGDLAPPAVAAIPSFAGLQPATGGPSVVPPPTTGTGGPAAIGGTDATRALVAWVFARNGYIYVRYGGSFRTVYNDAELTALGPYTIVGVRFSRGRNSQFSDADAKLLASVPWLSDISFIDMPISSAAVGSLAAMPGLEVLSLVGCPQVNDAALVTMARSPRLMRLYLSNTAVTDQGLAHLAGLRGLQSLSLSNCRITDAGLVHLQNLVELDYLNLDNTGVTDAGLAQLRGLRDLDTINMINTQVTGRGLAAFEQALDLDGMYMSGSKLNDAGAEALGRLTRLMFLYIPDTAITDAGIAKLAGLQNLSSLDVSGCRIGDASAPVLARLSRLTYLRVGRTQLSPAAVQAIQTQLPRCRIMTN